MTGTSLPLRPLGKTGLQVSAVSLGAAPFGRVDDEVAAQTVHRALELGVNLIDTSPLYGDGESERRLGLALAAWWAQGGKRSDLVLCTKTGTRSRPYDYSGRRHPLEHRREPAHAQDRLPRRGAHPRPGPDRAGARPRTRAGGAAGAEAAGGSAPHRARGARPGPALRVSRDRLLRGVAHLPRLQPDQPRGGGNGCCPPPSAMGWGC